MVAKYHGFNVPCDMDLVPVRGKKAPDKGRRDKYHETGDLQ